MRLESYVEGKWVSGKREGRPLYNASTGEIVAYADASGIDAQAALRYARQKGGPALLSLTFAERGAILRSIADVLIAIRAKYGDIARINSGNTVTDAAVDIDGGIATLKYYARLAQELGSAKAIIEPGEAQLSKEAVFFARHIWTSRPGVALQINAYNFPSWGLWEKASVALLAGVPSIAKPATATAWLAFEMVRDVMAAEAVPNGALSLVCGDGEALLDALEPMDSLAFTGSCDTAKRLRSNSNILLKAPRISIEADSVNATIIGPDAVPGTEVFGLAVREIVKALSIKAGQLCTNIRRVFVPVPFLDQLREAVIDGVSALPVGDPADPAVRIGPLVNAQQRDLALAKLEQLKAEASIVFGGGIPKETLGGDAKAGGFFSPALLVCSDPANASAVHEIEVFGPCATLMPYRTFEDAISMAGAGGGWLSRCEPVFERRRERCEGRIAAGSLERARPRSRRGSREEPHRSCHCDAAMRARRARPRRGRRGTRGPEGLALSHAAHGPPSVSTGSA
ncbi:MAG: 3,4-dehydroadipyl-CoA semialdehyde dehydrogenase [Rhodomicrobium sp.]